MGARALASVRDRSRTAPRTLVRHAGAALAAVTATVYLLIGVDVIRVVDPATAEPGGLLTFGLLAGGAYALGAALLVSCDRRPLWLLGAAFQVFVVAMYVAVASERTPPFEAWGVALRVPQLLLFGALAYLYAAPGAAATGEPVDVIGA
jgi:hypothetical protein